jgi:hypothetical protein
MLNKLIPLLILSLLCCMYTTAQLSTHNPFSSFGLGDENGTQQAATVGLGHATNTYFDSTFLNISNPSTYNSLGTGQPVFSLGLNAHLSYYSQQDRTLFRGLGMVDHFALGFTIKKHFGLTFGLKPYSKRGYNIQETLMAGTDSIKHTYLGTGGFNQAFIGVSTHLLQTRSASISVGANLGYLFGTTNNERRSSLITGGSSNGGVAYEILRLSSLHLETGMYYRQAFGSNHHLTVAGTFEPEQNLNALADEFLFYGIVGNPNSYDTLMSSERIEGTVTIPNQLSVGIQHCWWFDDVKKNNTIRNSELSFHANLTQQDWNNFQTTFDNNPNLLSTSKWGVGLQYIPERKFLENAVSSSFLERIRYRIGYFQGNLPYSFQGIQIQERGITMGFGIPIVVQNSLSSIQFGLTLGDRSTGTDSGFREQYTGIQLGLCIAPGFYERWFRKRKLD